MNRLRFDWLNLLLVLGFVLSPFAGMAWISPAALWETGSLDHQILWQIRLPRVLLGFTAGAILALCGVAYQALFQNPLTTPFTLGVASGASLGVTLYLWSGISFSLLKIPGNTWSGYLGACFATLLVFGLSARRKPLNTQTLLLTGVALTFFFSSLVLFLQYRSQVMESLRVMRWLMGSLDSAEWRTLMPLVPLSLGAWLLLHFQADALDLISGGETLALSKGLDVSRFRFIVFFGVSLLVGAVVAACGPIAFVGLIVPHICRLRVGNAHRPLLAASFLFGGCFLTLCDTLARMLAAPSEMPVGIITALLGGPFFLWLLLTREPSR